MGKIDETNYSEYAKMKEENQKKAAEADPEFEN